MSEDKSEKKEKGPGKSTLRKMIYQDHKPKLGSQGKSGHDRGNNTRSGSKQSNNNKNE